jgi:hypothetical protein
MVRYGKKGGGVNRRAYLAKRLSYRTSRRRALRRKDVFSRRRYRGRGSLRKTVRRWARQCSNLRRRVIEDLKGFHRVSLSHVNITPGS